MGYCLPAGPTSMTSLAVCTQQKGARRGLGCNCPYRPAAQSPPCKATRHGCAVGLVPNVHLTGSYCAWCPHVPPSSPRSNRVTGVYELSLCHVADAGSPGRPLPCSLCYGGEGHFVREPGFPGVTRVTSAKLLFWGALPFEAHVLTFGLAELFWAARGQ